MSWVTDIRCLSDEIWESILPCLDAHSIRQLSCVCRQYHRIVAAWLLRRNTRLYNFLVNDILVTFRPTYWALVGSAALWLLMYLQKKKLFWPYRDVDVAYIGPPSHVGSIVNVFTEGDPVWPDPDAQPTYLPSFRKMGEDGYSSRITVERTPGPFVGQPIKIDAFISSAVRREQQGSCITIDFDMPFLNMAAQLSDRTLTFWFSAESEHSRPGNPKRIKKYEQRLGLTYAQMQKSARYWQQTNQITFNI